MRLTVRVEKKHINEGRRSDSARCPIALALNEQHPQPEVWSVGTRSAAAYGRDLNLPEVARRFVTRYDAYVEVQPLAFDLSDE